MSTIMFSTGLPPYAQGTVAAPVGACFCLVPVQWPAPTDCMAAQLPKEQLQGFVQEPPRAPAPEQPTWRPAAWAWPVLGPAPAAEPPRPVAAPVAEQPAEPPAEPQGVPGADGVEGRVWALAQDSTGSRLVQRALEEAADDQARVALAGELRGHVLEAMRCPHANHVLQKCIVSMRPTALQFVVDEIAMPDPTLAVQVARHKYGCRILQRLLEHCRRDQLHSLVEALSACAVALSKHAYANFVVQHLLEYGSEEERRRLSRLFEQHAKALGKDDHGRAVLSAALAHTSPEERMALARAILRSQGLLVRMARTRQGHAAVRSVLEVLQGEERQVAYGQLVDGVAKLRLSRYGRMVLASLF